MGAIYVITTFLFLIAGIYSLFANQAFLALHYLLIALYVHASFFELKGQPFSRPLYIGVALFLAADAVIQLFFFQPSSFLGGIISFFLSFSAWQSAQRQRPSH